MTTITVPKDAPLRHATTALTAAGIGIAEVRDIPHGHQIRGTASQVVNVYTTGKVVVQGPGTAAVQAAFARYQPDSVTAPPAPIAAPKPAPIKPNVATADPVDVPEHTPRRPANWSDRAWNGRDDDVPF